MSLQLDLFAEAYTPAPPAVLLTPIQAALMDFLAAVRIQRADIAVQLLASPWTPDEKRCARLVNLINRGVASDRPALTLESIAEASRFVPNYFTWAKPGLVEKAIR